MCSLPFPGIWWAKAIWKGVPSTAFKCEETQQVVFKGPVVCWGFIYILWFQDTCCNFALLHLFVLFGPLWFTLVPYCLSLEASVILKDSVAPFKTFPLSVGSSSTVICNGICANSKHPMPLVFIAHSIIRLGTIVWNVNFQVIHLM